MITVYVCFIIFISASYTDIRQRIIPNSITIPSALAGLLFCTIRSGTTGFVLSLEGLLTGAALLFIPFVLGGTGGGDVKLLASVGAWVGAEIIFSIFIYCAIIGGFLSLGLFVRNRIASTDGKFPLFQNATIPYSIPMAVGFLVYLVSGKVPL